MPIARRVDRLRIGRLAPGAIVRVAAAASLPVRSQDPERVALPVACGEGLATVQDARRQEPGRAERES